MLVNKSNHSHLGNTPTQSVVILAEKWLTNTCSAVPRVKGCMGRGDMNLLVFGNPVVARVHNMPSIKGKFYEKTSRPGNTYTSECMANGNKGTCPLLTTTATAAAAASDVAG